MKDCTENTNRNQQICGQWDREVIKKQIKRSRFPNKTEICLLIVGIAVAVGPTKNIWHVFNGNGELIQGKSSDGSTFGLAVYIGLLDGKLKVVR
jgi:hypothetical protein